jgi:hypothetical protein
MKRVLTQTSVLLLMTFAVGVACYVSAAKDLFILSYIFLGLEIVFSFLAVLSRGPKRQRRGKLILMSVISAIAILIFILYGT